MSDFGGYGAILREARALDEAQRAKPLIDCPVCGEPLKENARGEVNCPLGHFRASSRVQVP